MAKEKTEKTKKTEIAFLTVVEKDRLGTSEVMSETREITSRI